MGELNLKKIQVRNNSIITTAERLNVEEHIELEHDKVTGILFKNMSEANNAHKLVQRVVNVGPMVKDIKEGDWVSLDGAKGQIIEGQVPTVKADTNSGNFGKLMKWVVINPLNYLNRQLIEQKNGLDADINEKHMKEVYGPDYEFPTIILDGVEHLMLYDRDVEYIILDAVTDGKEIYSER